MELRQLAYVEAVARHRHFTRAAEELHVAQSALSHQIRKLEAELGSELFERTSRRVVPTEAGLAVARRARRALAEVEATRGDLDELHGLVRGRVAIGALLPAGDIYVPDILVRFRQAYPGVDVALQAGTAANVLDGLAADELDVAFFLAAEPVPATLETIRLSTEELVIAYPPGRAPARKRMTVAALKQGSLVSPQTGSATKAAIDRFLGADASDVRISLESGDPYFLRCLVAEGFGAAVLPRSLTTSPGPPVEVRPLQPAVRLPVLLGWRRDRHLPPAAAALIDFVRPGADGAD